VSTEPPPPEQAPDAPGPNSDDFDAKQHIWDGTNWWSLDKQRRWDGSRWNPVAAPAVVSAEPPPPPKVSPDGKFYWDGTRWVPMQASENRPRSGRPEVEAFPEPGRDEAAQQKRGLRERLGMTGALNSCVGYGCLAIALVFAFVAISAFCGAGQHG
jgi:hypothetical protein